MKLLIFSTVFTLIFWAWAMPYIIRNTDLSPSINYVQTEMIYPSNELTKENVYAEIMRCDIKFSDIVLSQTLLETGHYKSHNCLQRNNLLGLKGGEKTPDNLHGYRIFNHWRESIQCYKDWQETRLTDSCTDYFQFLVDWKYAESPEYCDKLRSIVSVFKIIIKK